MTMQHLLAELESLDESDLEQLKVAIALRENELRNQQPTRTPTEWGSILNQFLDDFWGDTSAAEQQKIIDAIRIKNISSDQEAS